MPESRTDQGFIFDYNRGDLHFYRRETRVELTLALAGTGLSRDPWTLALVPYVIVAHGPATGVRCAHCNSVRLEQYAQTFGVAVLLNAGVFSASATAERH